MVLEKIIKNVIIQSTETKKGDLLMTQPIITRFAPSPTGYMHIGNLRTALYAYLLAKNTNGKFILRIEDTDRQRLVEGATDVILNTLQTTGLLYDEGPEKGGPNGPYIQSERGVIYEQHVKKLIDSGKAYYCFCTKERLEGLNDSESDIGAGYDRHCRNLSAEEVAENLKNNVPYVIRQKMPLSGTTSYFDEIFGEISVENSELQDQILMKADGMPTYNFAHVVDDFLMGVTHVVRGSEYVTSTPKYALLYDDFGWQRPKYVHLPLLMGRGEDGSVSKLSKRHGAVSFDDLINSGYLPSAIINYIALLGWCPKNSTQEMFALGELCDVFSIEGISKSPSVFDYDKLLWFNGEYIKALSFDEFLNMATPYLQKSLKTFTNAQIESVAKLLQPRISVFSEIEEKTQFLAQRLECDKDSYFNKKSKTTPEMSRDILKDVAALLQGEEHWNNDTLFTLLKGYAEQKEIKAAAVMFCVRVAVARISVTPGGATELMAVLGKKESIERIEQQAEMLANV